MTARCPTCGRVLGVWDGEGFVSQTQTKTHRRPRIWRLPKNAQATVSCELCGTTSALTALSTEPGMLRAEVPA